MLTGIFQQVFVLSVYGAIAASLIFLVKLTMGSRFPVKFHYAIWFILLLRLALPVHMESRISIFNAFRPLQDVFMQRSGDESLDGAYTHSNIAPPLHQPMDARGTGNYPHPDHSTFSREPVSSLDWRHKAAYVWLGGALLLLGSMGVSYIKTSKTIKLHTVSGGDGFESLIDESKREAGFRRKIRVLPVRSFETPFIFGFLNPTIIIPYEFSRKIKKSHLKNILLHEFTHLKRHDPLVRLFMLLLQAVHWFNPLVWIGFYQMARDCERACDATLIKKYDQGMRNEYASTLLNIAETRLRNNGVSPILAFGESNIKNRIRDIITYRPYTAVSLGAALVILALIGAVLLTSAVNPWKARFELYLVEGMTFDQAYATPLSELTLESSPLITGDDLRAYHWDSHTLWLKDKDKLNLELLRKPFVVVVNGERIYMGVFWSGVFSFYPPEIPLYLDGILGEDNGSVSFTFGWGLTDHTRKIISDRKIYRTLRDLGLLKLMPEESFSAHISI